MPRSAGHDRHRNPNFQLTLRLPRDARTVGLVRSVATAALDRIGVQPTCIDDIRVGLSEACNNVIEHATASDAYEVRLEVDGSQCVSTVIDAGHGFDADSLAIEMPDEYSERSRGMAVMAAVNDRIEVSSQPDGGTIVRLAKTLIFMPDDPIAARFGPGNPTGPGSPTAT